MSEKQEDRRDLDQRRFRLDATVNITHILTTIGMMVAFFSWGTDIKNKLVQHEVEISNLRSNSQATTLEVRESLREINAKVDRLIERQSK